MKITRITVLPLYKIFVLICLGVLCWMLAGCKKDSENVQPDEASKVENFWRKISAPNVPRTSGVTGLLADGRVILTSGVRAGASFANAPTEIYDPTTDKWTIVAETGPECSAGGFFRLKNGKMILLNYGSAVVNVFDPATGKWTSIGQHGGQAGDWNTVSGACELENGNVILVGRSSLTVWNQKTSFVTYDMKSGSSSLRFATVHQVPGSDQFIVYGNQRYDGFGVMYELDPAAGNAPKPLTDPILGFAGIRMQSELLGNQLVIMGGSNGTNVGNSANAPTLFNATDKTYTRLTQPDGSTFGVSEVSASIVKDASGKIWFADRRLQRYYIDPTTQKVVRILNSIDPIKAVPGPFVESSSGSSESGGVLLKDGSLLVFDTNQAWITK